MKYFELDGYDRSSKYISAIGPVGLYFDFDDVNHDEQEFLIKKVVDILNEHWSPSIERDAKMHWLKGHLNTHYRKNCECDDFLEFKSCWYEKEYTRIYGEYLKDTYGLK